MPAVQDERIRFIDERERELYGAAVLGEKVRQFLTADPVGQLMHHRAKIQLQQCEVDALKVDVDGLRGWFFARRKLRHIHIKAEVSRAFISWMADAIMDGDKAARELEDYRNPE
jgi:hypothetical protein